MPKGRPKNGVNKGWKKKGSIPWNKGKTGFIGFWTGKKRPKASEETKEKHRIARAKQIITPEHKKNLSESHREEKNPNWKGGNTRQLDKIIRESFKYRQWRSDVFTRDDFTCRECGQKGGKLIAHHIKSFATILEENNINNLEEALLCEELWNINNGQTLCNDCHLLTNNYGGKKLKV